MADDPEDATFIQPPDNLTGKVRMGSGGVDEATLKKAEALIANLQGDYLQWASEDADHLAHAWSRLKAAPSDATAREEMFRIAHDMKGQGGSFGYDLITVVGDRLCRLLEKLPDTPSQTHMAAIRLHVQTMQLIITQRMEGDGGAAGQELVAGLDKVSEKTGV